jgi:lipopolysaccharide/colanic/teichoic acid biosynthesis glycosyltransferase
LNLSQVEYVSVPHTRTLDVYGMEPHYFFRQRYHDFARRDKIPLAFGAVPKRMLDIVISGMAVVMLGVLTVIVWAAKKLKNAIRLCFMERPRIGSDGKYFNCWKFCTMRAGTAMICWKPVLCA